MSLPSVSVIVPCYGYAHLLEGCVESVLCQDGVEVEVLILDDCSPDGSAQVARALAGREPRVRARSHRENRGLIATANEGLEWAHGDYVVLLSADDLLTPGALGRAVRAMEANPSVGLVYGRAVHAHEGRPLPRPSGRWRSTVLWSGQHWIERRCRSAHNCISSPEAVVRSCVQRAVGGYDPRCHHASDLNMWLRIAAVADVAHIRGVPQAVYRIHSDSMLRSQKDPVLELRERKAAFDCFLESCCGAGLPQDSRLQAMVARALARQALWQASRELDRGRRDGLAQALSDFALEACPQAHRLREWHGLRLRRAIGAGRCRTFPPFLATGAGHRLKGHLGRVRWRITGL
jgi:hypothetical protein